MLIKFYFDKIFTCSIVYMIKFLCKSESDVNKNYPVLTTPSWLWSRVTIIFYNRAFRIVSTVLKNVE